jgi:hypothetical protein
MKQMRNGANIPGMGALTGMGNLTKPQQINLPKKKSRSGNHAKREIEEGI